MSRTRRRLPFDAFDLPIAAIAAGELSDKYFERSRQILHADGHDPEVVMQVFCRSNGVLCGMDEALAILSQCATGALDAHALYDGDTIEPWESVLTIRGRYADFAHLETLYLGVLARGTRVATQTHQLVRAASGKDILFFGARHDHPATQRADGYAALMGGAAGVATDRQGALKGLAGIGTMPHALIAAYGGDTELAAVKFAAHMPERVGLVALVDFDNDCVNTSLRVAKSLGSRLAGVRLDTSSSLIDRSLAGSKDARPGVNPALVRNVRQALDAEGFNNVQIVVSGGIDVQRIEEFRQHNSPVDAYGVGSSILRNEGQFDFTADIVEVDGRPVSKVGRSLQPNARLQHVDVAQRTGSNRTETREVTQ